MSEEVQAGDFGWIEVFHSLPSWKRCFIVFKKDDGEWVPNTKYELVNAAHIRSGYRVFRVKARKLEYYLTNGSKQGWDDNQGKHYHIGMPGRYVCGQGVFHLVGPADAAECERFLTGREIEITYKTSEDCKQMNVIYKADSHEWLEAPGIPMDAGLHPNEWKLVVPARTLEVAFTDGLEFWDSNGGKNYIIGSPAKYVVENGAVTLVTEAEDPSAIAAESRRTVVSV